jgi:hypothetical protein
MIFDLLSAPTADALKVSMKDNTVRRVGRRISNVARRVASTATGGGIGSDEKRWHKK